MKFEKCGDNVYKVIIFMKKLDSYDFDMKLIKDEFYMKNILFKGN